MNIRHFFGVLLAGVVDNPVFFAVVAHTEVGRRNHFNFTGFNVAYKQATALFVYHPCAVKPPWVFVNNLIICLSFVFCGGFLALVGVIDVKIRIIYINGTCSRKKFIAYFVY